MRPVREITSEMENLRSVEFAPGMETLKRDPVEPEPVGTIVLMAFRITGYKQDCDGSLMATVAHIDKDGEESGWEQDCIGLTPHSDLVVTADELRQLFDGDDENHVTPFDVVP